VCGFAKLRDETGPAGTAVWLGCGLSIGACILLRPDGGLLLAAAGAYWLWVLLKRFAGAGRKTFSARTFFVFFRVGVILAVSALAPLVPWTLRNLHTMHRFQPLAPRYANDADELPLAGFNRWSRTWIVDYASVEDLYWNVPGSAIDASRLPKRAFDTEQQRKETEQLFADYNLERDVTPELDARFAALAAARIHAAPLRYYLRLPAARIADMWLRPRTELLPPDPRWWEWNDEGVWFAVSIVFGLLNLAYVGLAVCGLVRWRKLPGIGLFVLFLLLRSLFLGTLENPEPRYTLEFYPVVMFAAAIFFLSPRDRNARQAACSGLQNPEPGM
jgi:hypothetical protein